MTTASTVIDGYVREANNWVAYARAQVKVTPTHLLVEHAVVALVALWLLRKLLSTSPKQMLAGVVNFVLKFAPGAQKAFEGEVRKEVVKAMQEKFGKGTAASAAVQVLRKLPTKGTDRATVLKHLKAFAGLDANAEKGTLFALVYAWGDEEDDGSDKKELSHHEVVHKAFAMFMDKNALNPMAFPSLRRMETEVIAMAANLFNGPVTARGTMTSGGTESLLMAVKTYREMAKAQRGVTNPNMILGITAHPALEKAAHYFQVDVIHVSVDKNLQVNVREMAKKINANTICLVGSAPQYPHGVVDNIEEIAALGVKHNLPVHVDACVGGFVLPWVEKLGFAVPTWDFRVKGVTSISADLHKYGYAAKGASCVVYRDELYRQYQFFEYGNWPGGLFASPSMLGTRSGGPIAGGWTSLVALGVEGFMQKTKEIMTISKFMQSEIPKIEGLEIMGSPHATVVAFRSVNNAQVNIFTVADVMESKFGWTIERQQKPDCIHMTLMPVHAKTCNKFVADLKAAVAAVRSDPTLTKVGSAAMYGMVAQIPSESMVNTFLKLFMQTMFSPLDAEGKPDAVSASNA